jgi:DNA-binding SARP family transcriptional activator
MRINSMRFRLLGPFEAETGGRTVALGRRRERLLLATLLLNLGRHVSVDRLVDLMWEDDPPATARRVVHSHVARLRAALADEPVRIVTVGVGYVLQAEPADVDVYEFAALVERAHDETDPARRAPLLAAALALWRGPVLSDLASDEFRDRLCADLELARATAREDWLAAELELGRHSDHLAQLRRLVAEEPDRERLAALYMLALYRSGNRAQALKVYGDLRARLAEEQGLDPPPEVAELHRAILRGDGSLECGRLAPVPAPAAAAPPLRAANLPPAPPDFVGRADILAVLDAVARPGALVTLTGVAGVGKTALLVRWANQIGERFGDGCLYLDLFGYADRAPMPADVAAELLLWGLGLPPQQVPGDADRKLAMLHALLAERRVLVLLDNARDAARVRPLLAPITAGAQVVASRDRLDGLAVRDGAHPLELPPLSRAEAVELLARTGRVAPGSADQLAEIAGLCDRLPLALRIVGFRLSNRSMVDGGGPAGVTARLRREERRLAVLEIDRADAGVRAAFAMSYRTLCPAERLMFRRLGLYPGGAVGLPVAAALAGTDAASAERSLAVLAQANMAAPDRSGRFTLHDLLRLFAREEAESADPPAECDAAAARLADLYLDTLFAAYPLLSPRRTLREPQPHEPPAVPVRFGDQEAATAWFDAERTGIAAAVRESVARGRHRRAWELAIAAFPFFHHRRRWREWIDVYEHALTAARADGDNYAQHRVLNGLGVAYKQLGKHATAADYYTRALAVAQNAGDHTAVGSIRINLSGLYNTCDRPDLAEQHLRAAAAVPGFAEDGRFGQLLWLNMSHLHFNAGRYEQAESCARRGLSLADRAGDEHTAAYLHHGLGEVAFQRRRYAEAAGQAHAELALARSARDPLRQAYALDLLASALSLEDPTEARARWQDAADLCAELHHPLGGEVRARLEHPAPAAPDEYHADESRRRLRVNHLP